MTSISLKKRGGKGYGCESRPSDLGVQIHFRTNRFFLLILFLTQLVAISPAQSSTWSTLETGLNGTETLGAQLVLAQITL